MNSDSVMRAMLTDAKTIAVAGLSDNPMKASYGVSRTMQRIGYRVVGVNPLVQGDVLGERCYASLADLVSAEGKPDIVNVFRLPKFIPAVVEEMIALGLENLWVQLGIDSPEAAAKAEAAGIHVVMDRCIMIEHSRLGIRD
ncbi:MAG TPA: CoA-binding protein [Acidobacteriaceae bacterium]|nr:CoA-binding protein [Acidobacteriaceae bacterium]